MTFANPQDVLSALRNPNVGTPPQQPQADPGRSLNLAASSPLSFGGQVGSPPANADATNKFGQALQQMLQKYQQLGTHSASQVQQGQLNYSDAGINAQNAQLTNPALQGYNPGTIMNAGSSASKPFDTASNGLGQVGQTFNEQLGNFGNILSNTKQLLADQVAAQEKAQTNARDIINTILTTTDPASLHSLGQDELAQLEKTAGYPKGFLSQAVTYKAKQAALALQKLGGSGGGGGTITTTTPIVDSATDAGVKAIINQNKSTGVAGGTGWGTAATAIDAKYGAGTASKYDAQLKAVYQNGQSADQAFNSTQTTNYPAILQPYVNTSSSGVKYLDASTLKGTPTDQTKIIKAATAAGLKVITNKNTSADLVNIADANSKLDTIGTIMSTLTQPTVLARNLHNLGLTQFESYAQTDPQKAAAGALQSVGLDILKAISGIQGFRGNASVVAQINAHLPTIYDSQAVVQTKINFLRQLISDREDAIVGGKGSGSSSGSGSSGTTSGGDYNAYLKAIGQ